MKRKWKRIFALLLQIFFLSVLFFLSYFTKIIFDFLVVIIFPGEFSRTCWIFPGIKHPVIRLYGPVDAWNTSQSVHIHKYTESDSLHIEFLKDFLAFSTWHWSSPSPKDWWYAEYDWWSEPVRCLNYMPTERCRHHLHWFAHLHWSLHTVKWKIVLLKVQYKNLILYI